jgi:hypothetical protein
MVARRGVLADAEEGVGTKSLDGLSKNWEKIIQPYGGAATDEEVKRFEDEIGFELPDDYRRFLLTFNGGKIIPEHDIWIPEISCDIGVNYLWPLTTPSPSLGIVEARHLQECNRFCVKQAMVIGDDGGTGFFYLVLAGEKKGATYFIWKDDVFTLPPHDWESWEIRIPDDFVEISPDFDSLEKMIIENASEGSAT